MSTAEGDDQDLTRKQRREQAREERRELEQAQAASAQRRTRLIQLGAVGVIVVAIIVGIVVATSGGGKSQKIASENSAEANKLIGEVSALVGGIPQNANALGSPTAPVTLQYFGDLQCPVCRAFTEGALKPLIETDVRTGKLRIEYRSLQTATPEPETFKTQQVAALAAGKQQKAWYYIELFYRQQGEEKSGYVTQSYLQGLARQVPGLNQTKWASDRSDPALSSEVTSDGQAANGLGFTGTPSFTIGKTGGSLQKFEPASFTDPTSFESAVEKLSKG
ncbi:MAG TPA: thioredoxin domain-containing protein [Solirubrobacteraceae bacterium]|jgi:protein-disulfide isomerase|nr:thioredoxin domain-containing protein [Solirubrobacteraceae bacterium]